MVYPVVPCEEDSSSPPSSTTSSFQSPLIYPDVAESDESDYKLTTKPKVRFHTGSKVTGRWNALGLNGPAKYTSPTGEPKRCPNKSHGGISNYCTIRRKYVADRNETSNQ